MGRSRRSWEVASKTSGSSGGLTPSSSVRRFCHGETWNFPNTKITNLLSNLLERERISAGSTSAAPLGSQSDAWTHWTDWARSSET